MGFSLLCWNIEKFNDSKPERIQAVADAIRAHDPDVIGILEFLAKDAARRLVRDFFPDYDFAFTDSKMAIEILVGWRRGRFAQVLYTQRRELQAGSENLRPGGLLCVRQKNSQQFNNMLFLHTDSGVTAKEYKTRRTMFGKIFSLNKVLQTLHEQEGKSRFIALGDLNTMGRVKAPRVTPVTETEEIAQLVIAAGEANMQLLEKSAPKTWSSPTGSKKGNLDHVAREQGSGIQNSRNRRRTAGQSPGRRLGQQDGQRSAFVHREYFGPLDAVCRNRISEREMECGAAKRRALFS